MEDKKQKGWHWDYKHKKSTKQNQLGLDFIGFMVTCNSKFQERSCVKEALNILHEFTDDQQQDQGDKVEDKPENGKKTHNDIDDDLKKEVELMKEKRCVTQTKRFQVVDGGANGTIFIKSNLENTVDIANKIVSHIAETKEQKSRFILRFIPVEVTCRANMDEIMIKIDPLLNDHFIIGMKSFSVMYRHTYHDKIKRDDITAQLATKVMEKNPTNRVDLSSPDLVIMVEVIRGLCCLSIIPDYFKLKKYNLMSLVETKEVKENNNVKIADEQGQENTIEES